jgi:hypothetical protein
MHPNLRVGKEVQYLNQNTLGTTQILLNTLLQKHRYQALVPIANRHFSKAEMPRCNGRNSMTSSAIERLLTPTAFLRFPQGIPAIRAYRGPGPDRCRRPFVDPLHPCRVEFFKPTNSYESFFSLQNR